MQSIVVIGSTGNLGRAVVNALSTKGMHVRAAARDPGKVAPGTGVEPISFDYAKPTTHGAALEGGTGLLLIAPPLDPEAPAKLNPIIALAKARGVRHVVLVSALGVDATEQAPLRIVERQLLASGVPATIRRPNSFMVITDDVENVTGKKPATFEDFARRAAAAWA